jgi:S-adenosylmethionine decarboxylase
MSSKIKGGHYIIDFFGCDPHQINKIKFWKKELPLAVKEAGMDILHSHFHEFDPQGITGFLLLSSSHLSIHTWPEYNYVAFDIFSCSHGEETKKAVDYLKSKLEHSRAEKRYIKRGYVTQEFLESPIYSTGKTEHIRINTKLAEAKAIFEDESSSKELIKSTAQSLEETINQIEEEATKDNAEVLIKQMDNLIIKADEIAKKVESQLSKLKAAGTDVSEIEQLLEDYKADIVKTKADIVSAKAKYGEMKSTKELAALAKEVRTLVNNAKNNLQKAVDKLKLLTPKINQARGDGGNNNNGGDNNDNNKGDNPSSSDGGNSGNGNGDNPPAGDGTQ